MTSARGRERPIDHDALIARLLALHDDIRRDVHDALRRGRAAQGLDPAADEARVAAEGAGDVSFGIDLPAEAALERFHESWDGPGRLVLVAEGLGRRDGAAPKRDGPALRLIADPLDGTRNLMFGMRSAWILTAIAPEGDGAPRLADVEVAVQSEVPPLDRSEYHVLTAVRGKGAHAERRRLDGGATLARWRLSSDGDDRLDNGFYVFFKFSPEDRLPLARLEEAFLRRLVAAHGVDRRTLYDDQYISNAGQLFLLATHRYRFLADLRGWVGDRLGVANFTTKPYDVCCARIATEAGCVITGPRGAPLDVPLDVEHRVSFVAYPNRAVERRLAPLLAAAQDEFEAGGGG